jgi:hypothetical protein
LKKACLKNLKGFNDTTAALLMMLAVLVMQINLLMPTVLVILLLQVGMARMAQVPQQLTPPGMPERGRSGTQASQDQ